MARSRACIASLSGSRLSRRRWRFESSLRSRPNKISEVNHLRECISIEIASRVRSTTCGGQAALDDVRNWLRRRILCNSGGSNSALQGISRGIGRALREHAGKRPIFPPSPTKS
jgi:hypothetical protein